MEPPPSPPLPAWLECDPRGGQGCAKKEGDGISFHLFPAPGDENPGCYLDDLLSRAFVCLFVCVTERNLHSFQMSVVPLCCLSHLPTLRPASRWTNLSDSPDFLSSLRPTLQGRVGEMGEASEQLSLDSLENPELQMWVQIGLKNLMRSGFLGLPAFSLSSVLNINGLSVF